MSDEIKPALTPEEWKTLRDKGTIVRGCNEVYAVGPLFQVSDGLGEDSTALFPSAAPALIAMLNDNLEAGHPLKITRKDVEELEFAAHTLETEGRYHEGVAAIATKLAAMLPPT